MFGYACYTERFAGDLAGIADHLDYLGELGVTYLHLMPLLQPRDGDNDGGYAVQDYRSVRADLGTTDDLRDLAATLRDNGISLVLDLVLNHETTPLMRDAQQRGGTVANGQAAFLASSAATFRLVTGQAAPNDVMRQALANELGLAVERVAVVGD
jgi:hypothetical protein